MTVFVDDRPSNVFMYSYDPPEVTRSVPGTIEFREVEGLVVNQIELPDGAGTKHYSGADAAIIVADVSKNVLESAAESGGGATVGGGATNEGADAAGTGAGAARGPRGPTGAPSAEAVS